MFTCIILLYLIRIHFKAVKIQVGNEITDSNPLPVILEATLRICCSIPNRIVLSIIRQNDDYKCPHDTVGV